MTQFVLPILTIKRDLNLKSETSKMKMICRIIIVANLNVVRVHLLRGVSQNMSHSSRARGCTAPPRGHTSSTDNVWLRVAVRLGGLHLSGSDSLPRRLPLEVPPLPASPLVALLLLLLQTQLLQLLPGRTESSFCTRITFSCNQTDEVANCKNCMSFVTDNLSK